MGQRQRVQVMLECNQRSFLTYLHTFLLTQSQPRLIKPPWMRTSPRKSGRIGLKP
jgi:hypothetical protein